MVSNKQYFMFKFKLYLKNIFYIRINSLSEQMSELLTFSSFVHSSTLKYLITASCLCFKIELDTDTHIVNLILLRKTAKKVKLNMTVFSYKRS